MSLISNFLKNRKKKNQAKNEACNKLIASIDEALHDAKSIFAAQQSFVDPAAKDTWEHKYSQKFQENKISEIHRLKKASRYKELTKKWNELLAVSRSLAHRISEHNERVASSKIQEAYSIIGNVEGRKLDRQQILCIVKEVHNHLVIAGAGAGKTTTVVGKIKYLIRSGKCLPQDILVLSFTNASAAEMSERIAVETGYDISASTFHKLGLNIISQADGVKPNITRLNLQKFVKEQLLANMRSKAYLSLLNAYLAYNRVVAKSEFEFETEEDYNDYLNLNPPTTINNETVKSYGEMDIANFLAENGIRYIYEHPYEVDTRTSEYGQYCPDFFLPDYNIYIEYFGVNRDGEVPSYFKGSKGKTASEAYNEGIRWKRETHRANQTTMIECYAYEKLEGTLLDALKEKLEKASVILRPKSYNEMREALSDEGDSVLNGFVDLIVTVINLMKSSGYDTAAVRKLNCAGSNMRANNILLSLIEPIFTAYCQYLSEHNEIDFNDMINLAAEYVRQGRYINPYKFVIVDEYQDISKARFALLDCLRKSKDYDLFCVGDDWQSIYRFAGSDIGYILNFPKYWGATEISRIETTYRFSQTLINISGGFVMQNPAQIKKSIKGRFDDSGFPLGEISAYTDKYAIEFMAKKMQDLPVGSIVFLIGRYSFDIKPISNSGLFSCCYNNTSGFVDVNFHDRPDLEITFMTAHKSKGLQADYVFIINNKNSKMGFPSKIQDTPILDLLLDDCDRYPYAEERRLYYVALTRAKKKAFVVVVEGQESEFALELKYLYKKELKKERIECPRCGGYLIRKSGPYGEFWGCSNYRTTKCEYTRSIH